MPYLISLIVSWIIGYLLVNILFFRQKPPNFYLHLCLGLGLGLGLSGQFAFGALAYLNHYSHGLTLALHILALLVLAAAQGYLWNRHRHPFVDRPSLLSGDALGLIVLAILAIPLTLEARAFPFGGWDAWSCWNLKARFIFLGGEHWQNMFDPVLWRTNTHYPFLLPLINVWGWGFYGQPAQIVPMINAIVFTLLTAGILLSGVKTLTGQRRGILAPVLLGSLPFFVTLAVSQYSDIVAGCYLLATVICLLLGVRRNSPGYLMLAGLFIGILSFTKTEGTVASVILLALFTPYLWLQQKSLKDGKPRLLAFFVPAAAACGVTAVFQLFFAPGNVTFINGLISSTHPASLERLKFIFAFLGVELISKKWMGIWILLAAGAALNWKQCFGKTFLIVPVFLVLYLAVALAYYFVNTYFPIAWWLTVSLNRILFTILPTVVFWIFAGLEKNERQYDQP